MAVTYSLNQDDVKIKIKVKDCITDTTFDVSTITDQKIVFVKPDGTTFEKQATLTTDPQTPTESFITYHNTPPEASIWDLIGKWEYTGKITLATTGVAQLSERRIAWVT